MNKIRVLIIDPDPHTRDGIALLLRDDPEIEVVDHCLEGESWLPTIRKVRPDLIFLDVGMPRLGGLDLYDHLGPDERPAIIFVTADESYAARAFDMSAVDYVLKPFGDARFKMALARAKEQIRRLNLGEVHRRVREILGHLQSLDPANEHSASKPAARSDSRLIFKVGSELLFMEAEEIAWIEADGKFVRLRTRDQIHHVREPLHSIEKRLAPAIFVRVHRSFIVNVAHIRRITPMPYGDRDVLMTDGTVIRWSRSFRGKLKQLISSGQIDG